MFKINDYEKIQNEFRVEFIDLEFDVLVNEPLIEAYEEFERQRNNLMLKNVKGSITNINDIKVDDLLNSDVLSKLEIANEVFVNKISIIQENKESINEYLANKFGALKKNKKKEFNNFVINSIENHLSNINSSTKEDDNTPS